MLTELHFPLCSVQLQQTFSALLNFLWMAYNVSILNNTKFVPVHNVLFISVILLARCLLAVPNIFGNTESEHRIINALTSRNYILQSLHQMMSYFNLLIEHMPYIRPR